MPALPLPVSEAEGRAAFQRLASGRLWKKDPLDYFLFLNLDERRYLVLWLARNHGQDYLPDGVDLLMVSYLNYEEYYPRQQFQSLKKGPKMIKKYILNRTYIPSYKLPDFIHAKFT